MTTYYLKSFLLLFVLFAISCGDSEDPDVVMECPDDALHTLDNATGSMIYLTCFDAWGVDLDESIHFDDRTIVANVDIDDAYKVDGLRVQVDACLYEFDLPLLFPDPAPWGYLYNMDNIRMIEE